MTFSSIVSRQRNSEVKNQLLSFQITKFSYRGEELLSNLAAITRIETNTGVCVLLVTYPSTKHSKFLLQTPSWDNMQCRKQRNINIYTCYLSHCTLHQVSGASFYLVHYHKKTKISNYGQTQRG